MIELVLILFGSEAARRRWWLLGLTGIAWFGLGAFIFVNAFIEEVRINPVLFVIPLVIDGLISLVAAFGSSGTGKGLRYSRAGAMFFVALLVYATAGRADMVIGFVVGTLLVADASWRAGSAYIVRFRGWGRAMAFAAVEFLLGVWSFLPWPTQWQGQVGQDVGLLLMFSAAATLALTWRLARLPPGVPMSRAVEAGLLNTGGSASFVKRMRREDEVTHGRRITGTVHVWTPTGALASVDQAVSRYVAALDAKGVISTGHAAFEADDLYISHYPAVEIERSATDFRRTLRATRENDVPGRFQPSYREEADGWTESTMKIRRVRPAGAIP